MTGIFVFYIITLETELEILSCICSNYSFVLLTATVHCSLQCWLLLQHAQTLVHGRQAAFDATIQTLQAHYGCTDNAACTDNSLEISHLSVQIYTDNNRNNSRLYYL